MAAHRSTLITHRAFSHSSYRRITDNRAGLGRTALLQTAGCIVRRIREAGNLNAETRHLIDAPQLQRMKKSAYLVNTARGGVVRHEALVAALKTGEIAGAGLEVLENKPEGMAELLRFPSCIVTPHSAFYSQESLLEMRRKSALTVREALLHGKLLNVVNLPGTAASK